ncbi:MAG: energy-coupled thiamine transporter ThiT [Oscillospiraceae bacterium]|nr:energy-coupled thiamine transporter ThiT [Oscillospiraceae bacterium]
MNNAKSRENLRALVESALLIAIGFVLSYITLFRMPQGGSVTPLSMLPILFIGIRHGVKWGLAGGFVYACLQMMQQFWPPPTGTVAGYAAVVILDYILAFSVLGLSGLFKNKKYGLAIAAPICLTLRFLCHFISGIIVWGVFAEDMPVWLFSLVYNGSYMGIEIAITTAISILLCVTAPSILFNVQKSSSQRSAAA